MNTNADFVQAGAMASVWPPVLAVDPGSQSTGVCLRVGTVALEAVTAETLVPPTPRPVRGRQAAVPPRVLEYLPGAATVLGAVLGTWPQTILVPPRGGAEGGWDAVEGAPENLRGRTPAGWLTGGSDRSHQRSAWAIAGAAHVLTAAPLAEQVRAASNASAARHPDLDPQALIPALRLGIAQTSAWDLLDRLPGLAAASVGLMTHGDRARAELAREAVAAYLEGEPQ